MSFQDFTGKTRQEAIQKACEELNTEEALLEIQVMEESTRGFLGLVGQRDARIRVRKRDILKEVLEVEPPAHIKALRTELVDTSSEAPADPAAPEHEVEPEVPENHDFEEPRLRPEVVAAAEAEKEARNAAAQVGLPQAQEVLTKILEKIPVEVEVEASIQDGAVYLNIIGDGSGLLIGKKGQTLDALQFLVNKIINKEHSSDGKVEIIVDTENYRLRKEENLRDIAFKMSQKAKKTLKPVSFNPMPPQERRLIHLILADDKEVYTKSYGEGAMRRIIVYPRKALSNKRRRR